MLKFSILKSKRMRMKLLRMMQKKMKPSLKKIGEGDADEVVEEGGEEVYDEDE